MLSNKERSGDYSAAGLTTNDHQMGTSAVYSVPMNRVFRRVAIILTLASFMTMIQAPAQAKSVFYLDMKKGCYAGNSPASNLLEWSLPGYKKVFSTSCLKRYHYQVYFISKLTTRLSDNEASQAQANDRCYDAAIRTIGSRKIDDNLSIGWFFPDAGAEEVKYGKKLICFFRIEDSNDPKFSVVQTRPMA